MSVEENLAVIQAEIKASAKVSSRKIDLIAVSKQQPDARIQAALACGVRQFGENRVHEASSRWSPLRPKIPDLELHLIGPLQTNKAADAVALFDVIQTLDREKLADVLAFEMQAQKRFLPCFIQVNTGAEDQKSGVAPDQVSSLLSYATKLGIQVVGLMCIPPVLEPAGVHFAFLKTLSDRMGLSKLSMGMSNDYKTAIMAGSTHIRVGSALFGGR